MKRLSVENRSAFRLNMLIFLLCVCVFASAQALVLIKHYGRAEVMNAQQLRWENDDLKSQWQRLQMEKSLLIGPDRLQSLAEKEWGMSIPEREQTKMVVVNESDL